MDNKTDWKKGFPTAEGYYWFYGYIFGAPWRSEAPRLEQLQARKCANGLVYIACSAFLNEREMLGFWLPLATPDTTGLDVQFPKFPESK